MTSDIPTTMKAIEIVKPGGPDVLVPCERPVPVPSVGEVLVAVKAAGVNRPDILQRKGCYPPPPGASDLPGLEIAGTVAALGPGAQGLNVGDEVCALVAGGGYGGIGGGHGRVEGGGGTRRVVVVVAACRRAQAAAGQGFQAVESGTYAGRCRRGLSLAVGAGIWL